MTQLIASNQLTLTNVNDGQTSYTHIAYDYSADGSDRFTTVYPNLNLLDGTKDFSGTWEYQSAVVNDGFYNNLIVKSQSNSGIGILKRYIVAKDGDYTFSAWVSASEGQMPSLIVGKNRVQQAKIVLPNTAFGWVRVTYTLKNVKSGDEITGRIDKDSAVAGKVSVAGHKWEEGSTATLWMPSASEVKTADWPSYIGQYTDYTQADSTDPTKYRWFLTKGIDGKDGKTPYIHFAYSDNADGTGLTTSDNGQRYIGHYSDYTQADSTDKTKYRWSDRWAKIEVGGVNQISLVGASVGYRIGFLGDNYPDSLHTVTKFIPVKYSNYVLSYDGELDNNPNYYYSLAWYTTPDISGFISRPTGAARQTGLINGIKLAPPANATYLRVSFPTNFDKVMLNGGTVKLNWSQSPEDIQSNIDTKADQSLTQQQLNMLIEKAQTIQTELEARAAMETLSDLERAYKAYVEANDKAVAKSQADLIEAGRRVDAMVETLGGLSKTKTFIETYIKEADEGIIIGTKDNVSQIRITYDRIAMYSAGKEVMYISQGVIHIDNGVFTKSLQIGRFRTEQHQTNLDINVCRYVG